MNRRSNNKIARLALPLFILWPLGGFLCALFDLRSKKSAFVYIGFAMLFGLSISFSNASADSYRYAEAFSRFERSLDYRTIIEMYKGGELRDLYRISLFYFISLFSNNSKILYAFAGLIYGIFSYLSLIVFVKEKGNKWDKYVFVLALIFYTYVSLSNINGFRFNTGALILFYSIYKAIIEKKTGWMLGILITPLFHYGFLLIVPVLVFYKLFENFMYNKQTVNPVLFYSFVIVYFVSWILDVNAIDLSFFNKIKFLSEGVIGKRIEYINSPEITELVKHRNQNSLFLSVQKYFLYGIKIYLFIVIVYLRKLMKRIPSWVGENRYTSLFAFTLFFYTVSLLATSIPSGGRFLAVAHLFLILVLVKFYRISKNESMRRIILASLVPFSFVIAFTNFMIPILILSPTFWYGNVFWIIYEGLIFLSPF